MKRLDALDYLKLNKWQKFLYNIQSFFLGIPGWFKIKFKNLFAKIKKFGIAIKDNFVDIGKTFKNGRLPTKVSFFIMGFGSFFYGQPLRGVLFLLMEIIFIAYMALPGVGGGYWLSKFGNLGEIGPHEVEDPESGIPTVVYGDDSFRILLYGIITILFIIAFIYTWRLNVKQCRICDEYNIKGKKVKRTKDDLRSLVDDQFHKSLLALPTMGILIFTIIPIIFMILVAFTNYTSLHNGRTNDLFTWVGFDVFKRIFVAEGASGGMAVTFGEVLLWTLIWAFFATFTNYFLGMFVAMLINKKGIRFKKWWRTVLVLSIAIPQFISLLYVSNMFSYSGVINEWLLKLGIISQRIHFMDTSANPNLARTMIILINIWIGIPYLMLITTGILMNIPQDLYESAKIDGANGWQQYTKITLPYMLFVTGPYLLTSFTSNLNNFNVIYLLSTGYPLMPNPVPGTGEVGYTDILITWLFKMTAEAPGEATYNLASVIGIMIFIVVSVISLIVYNLLPSMRNEEDFS